MDTGSEDGTVTLTIVSPQKLINDSRIASPNFGKGKLQFEVKSSGEINFFVKLSNKDNAFQNYFVASKQSSYVQIDKEIIKIKGVTPGSSFYQEVNATPSVGYEVVVKQPIEIFAGDMVDFTDSAGTAILEGVSVLHVRRDHPSTGLDTITHNGNTTSLNATDRVVSNYRDLLGIEQRGMFGTVPALH